MMSSVNEIKSIAVLCDLFPIDPTTFASYIYSSNNKTMLSTESMIFHSLYGRIVPSITNDAGSAPARLPRYGLAVT